ncbi:MAG: xanthine dehydrogenase family protein subunit M [Acidobacteria bacterium]|nr:xanthine dehydrogenase family protein subunit M [Acidobacteriota bacterium]
MYPRPFRYHRAASIREAVSLLAELGEEAKLLAGGQSLIPLMKLRLASPHHLVDLNFIPDLSYVRPEDGLLRFGALTRHAEVEASPAAQQIPILHDCAAGIADVQVRNRGTLGGSLAEADPSGDWAPVLLTLPTEVVCVGPEGERTLPLAEFFVDAYTTVLRPAELIREVVVRRPPPGSGGAYLAVKRSAPVYATATAAVQLMLADRETCSEAGIALGAVGLTPIKAAEAEAALRGQRLTPDTITRAAEAASAACDPQPDGRGSAAYKRALVGALVKRAIALAARRARGEQVEVSHIYA